MEMNQLHRTMRDSAALRWGTLFLIASTMFFAYMFVDVLSPLQTLVETQLGWSPDIYGTFASSEYFLNVFVFRSE
ncbi:MAG: MFS transporter, partial [Mediterranea sp.]|nr:MFS transporter [Mediterranea sp.]